MTAVLFGTEVPMRPFLPLVPLALILVGCGTPQYRAERAVCEAEWMQKIPPRMENQLVERVRYIRVPTGEMICRPVGDKGEQYCTSRTVLEDIPYTAVERVDVNRAERNLQIRACAARACLAGYGNTECKAPPAAAQ